MFPLLECASSQTKQILTHDPGIIFIPPQNPRREVERIMKYLDLSVSDEIINQIVELTSFKNMKENPMANYSCIPSPVFDQSISPFMRKGAPIRDIWLKTRSSSPTTEGLE